MRKQKHLLIEEDYTIEVIKMNNEDYISLTDMVKKYGDSTIIENWLRNKNTLEFLGVWESLNNSNFNSLEFEGIRNEAGLNRFVMSAKKWITLTRATGIIARAGRYGGTYAHKDIAFEFGSWISPEFKLIIIKEFQRLKALEEKKNQWNYHRFLSKVNYRLQTQSIKQIMLPYLQLSKGREWLAYAGEADLLNVAVFGVTAKDWRLAYPELANKGLNIRDKATMMQLTVLANLESLNSMMITEGKDKETRYKILKKESERQIRALIDFGEIRLNPGRNKAKVTNENVLKIDDDFDNTMRTIINSNATEKK